MNIINKENYIIWDNLNNCPKYNIIYHRLNLMTLLNRGFKISFNDNIKNVMELTDEWKKKIINFEFKK